MSTEFASFCIGFAVAALIFGILLNREITPQQYQYASLACTSANSSLKEISIDSAYYDFTCKNGAFFSISDVDLNEITHRGSE